MSEVLSSGQKYLFFDGMGRARYTVVVDYINNDSVGHHILDGKSGMLKCSISKFETYIKHRTFVLIAK